MPARSPHRLGTLVLTLATLAGAVGARAQEASQDSTLPATLPATLSAHGLPGLIHVPAAVALEPGWIHFSFNNTDDVQLRQGFDLPQRNFQFGLALFDRLMIGGRGTEAEPFERDLSANAQLLLLKEGRYRPSLAVGAQDVTGGTENTAGVEREGGNAIFEARYGVLTKTVLDRVRLTAGFGTGPDMLDGLFWGAEWFPSAHLSLMTEYDTERWGGGVRVSPLPERWVAKGVPRPTLKLLWGEEAGWSWEAKLRAVLDPDLLGSREGSGGSDAATALGREPGTVEGLLELLADQGFENLRAFRDEPGRLTVEYENRRYNQNEAEGLRRVVEAVRRRPPADVERVRLLVKEHGVPVVRAELAAAELANPDEARTWYAQKGLEGSGPLTNPSRLRSDLILRPGVETLILSEIGVFQARLHALPNLVTELWTGTTLDVEMRIPIAQTSEYDRYAGRLPDPGLERALLHHTRRVPLPGHGSSLLLAQWSGGRFDQAHVGFRQETQLMLSDGAFRVGTDVGLVGGDFGGLDRWVFLGSARYLHAGTNARVAFSVGRFLDGDYGTITDLSRFFGDTEVGVFLRDTQHGSIAGIRFALPLGPSRSLRPSELRPRLPSEWEYAQWTRVLAEVNILRNDIGRTLSDKNGLLDAYLDRDRLHPGVLTRTPGRSGSRR